MTFSTVLFYVLALVLIVAAFRVVIARSSVTAALHLILCFFTASMLWMLLYAEFLALLLMVVYVGAVMVLFLFVVMMLDLRMESLRAGLRTYLPLGLGIGLLMAAEMAFVLYASWGQAGPRSTALDGVDNTRLLGEVMFTDYAYAVQIGGAILLVGMVAAIALTLRRRKDVRLTRPDEQVRVRARDRIRLVSLEPQSTPSQPAVPATPEKPQ